MAVLAKPKAETHQQKLARLQAEVEALREQLRRAQRLASVGTMTAMVAHEFNNILTSIINYAHLARTNPSLTDKALARAADGGQRASSICRAILGVAGAGPAEAEQIHLEQLIRETLCAMGREPSQDGIELSVRSPAGLTIVARRAELQQVLLNLLLNAREALLAKNGPRRIEVAAERRDRRVHIHVTDTGVGMPPEDLAKIFEPFFTTRSSREGQGGGSGLGLTISREIITSMGGQILVRSTRGEGTTFTIRLPARAKPSAVATGRPDPL